MIDDDIDDSDNTEPVGQGVQRLMEKLSKRVVDDATQRWIGAPERTSRASQVHRLASDETSSETSSPTRE